jgi:hypothetical protein
MGFHSGGAIMLMFEPIPARWEASAFKGPVVAGRAKVSGDWVVGLASGTVNAQTVLCLVPDPDHRWDGSSQRTGRRYSVV